MELQISNVRFIPVSMVTHDDLQRVEIRYSANMNAHLLLDVWNGDTLISENVPVDIISGDRYFMCLLPAPKADFSARWILRNDEGSIAAEGTTSWKVPRSWEISVMVSSHYDIGLHNSQYVQRHNSEEVLDEAMRLCDETDSRPESDRYRYTMEGTWFWSNFGKDRGTEAAQRLVRDYIKPGKIGVCAGIAGNITEAYGLEEMCRSTYSRSWLKEEWDIDCRTMTMIDNNGISWGLVQPYVDAGYENLFFAPNCWCPLSSTITKYDTMIPGSYSVPTFFWNPQSGAGGSRIDVRYDSPLPLVFFWEGADPAKKLLVSCSVQYDRGGNLFGLMPEGAVQMELWEDLMTRQLPVLEERYPYEMWLLANYGDNQVPDLTQTNDFAAWNKKWKFPVFRTAGNLDEYYDRFRSRYADVIPTLRGEITGGWYMLGRSVADAHIGKYEADRILPQAETLSSFAALADASFPYPEHKFRTAWANLLVNDEHSYGCSGYSGSPVFETWLQHRQWVEEAREIADNAVQNAMEAISAKVSLREESVLLFNTTLQERRGWVSDGDAIAYAEHILPAGYTAIPRKAFRKPEISTYSTDVPPVIENKHYRIRFGSFGSMESIYDKALSRELLSPGRAPANTLLYTNDNHKTFYAPQKASFIVTEGPEGISVTAETTESVSGAGIRQTVTLPSDEKVIRVDNSLSHVNGLYNRNRYYRYLYYAFPFHVPCAKRLCHLNGCVAEYAKDLTGHGTDVYMNVRDWLCMENGEFGVGFMQLDGCLAEFDHIHPDKTDWDRAGSGSELYLYLANDWHQRQVKGGSELNYRFRYQITSYEGDHLSAGLPQMAERYANPLFSCISSAKTASLPAAYSFLKSSSPVRLLTVKRGHTGDGITVRLYDAERPLPEDYRIAITAYPDAVQQHLTTNETGSAKDEGGIGFHTIALGLDSLRLSAAPKPFDPENHAPIGSWETGLIHAPRGGCSDEDDLIYLLWGQSMDKDLVSYELYRGSAADFVPNEENPHAIVEPGPYRVVRFEDHGCEANTRYYYRVRAVFADGSKTALSDVFSAATREPVVPEGLSDHTIIP